MLGRRAVSIVIARIDGFLTSYRPVSGIVFFRGLHDKLESLSSVNNVLKRYPSSSKINACRYSKDYATSVKKQPHEQSEFFR